MFTKLILFFNITTHLHEPNNHLLFVTDKLLKKYSLYSLRFNLSFTFEENREPPGSSFIPIILSTNRRSSGGQWVVFEPGGGYFVRNKFTNFLNCFSFF